MILLHRLALTGILLVFLSVDLAQAARIKDLAGINGVRDNPLVGYGLVVGLDGTGDQTPFTNQSILNMLQQNGVNLPPGTNPKSKNVAAVMVTGTLEAFAQPGQNFDVTVASIGTAKSMRGGTLLMTPLKGADGQIYALAQGNLSNLNPPAQGAGSPPPGLKTANIVVNGGVVERPVETALADEGFLSVELKKSDFNTARQIAELLNVRYGFNTAELVNGRVIRVKVPLGQEAAAFVGQFEMLDIAAEPLGPKVVINVRTGAIVMNQAVTLGPCAVSHGTLSIVISQSPPLTQTMPAPTGKLMMLEEGVLLSEVVNGLNRLGATPQDLLVILQAMRSSGALRAELEVI